MHPVNTIIIVQNIPLLAVNGSVQNDVVFLIVEYEIICCITSNCIQVHYYPICKQVGRVPL
jgi:hypothetical protein